MELWDVIRQDKWNEQKGARNISDPPSDGRGCSGRRFMFGDVLESRR